MALKSAQQIYDIVQNEIESIAPELNDFSEGSILDILSGAVAAATSEVNNLTINEFAKTFFDTANGPEVTSGPDDLERLAVDHYGEAFRRPKATKAIGTVKFSRPAGRVTEVNIPAGTVVKTAQSAFGTSVRFVTTNSVLLQADEIDAFVEAVNAGPEGNVTANKVTQIESSLTEGDVTVTNLLGFSGGTNAYNDAEYREFIRGRITSVRGSTRESLEAAAKTVVGVKTATASEVELPVIEYNIATSGIAAGAEFFRIPMVTMYVADANGTANTALIGAVRSALDQVRAFGVYLRIIGAVAVPINWSANIALNISGPNYATLSNDLGQIEDLMRRYINDLPIGADFIRADAETFILNTYGPAGTNDILSFTTSVPSSSVVFATNEKIVPGVIEVQ